MKEFRIIGRPGSGKTSRFATRDVPRAVIKYGADKVMITSFTRAAAREIATKKSRDTGRTINLPRRNVGTLHSICYHALGAPVIIEEEKNLLAAWNEQYPAYTMTGSLSKSIDDPMDGDRISSIENGDMYLALLNIRRNRLTPLGILDARIKKFEELWTKFKSDNDCMDYTDLIETGLKKLPYAPGQPSVLFIDEAQDFTPLQLKLARSWALNMDFLVLTGDPDQCIYSWSGCSPDNLIVPKIDDKMMTSLEQSYRLPREILNFSSKTIKMVKQRVADAPFAARRVKYPDGEEIKGSIIKSEGTWRNPGELVDTAEHYLEEDKSIMFLTSCAYMLDPLKKTLRSRGLPFCNPYRSTRGDWNPLGPGNGTSARDLILNFLENGIDDPYWNIPQFVSWAKFLKVGDGQSGLKRKDGKAGIKRLTQAIEDNEPGLHTSRNVLKQILTDTGVNHALARNTKWLLDHIESRRKAGMEYPLLVFNKHGIDALAKKPQITIGTIHSVKGGESNVVILMPDISWKAKQEWNRSRDGMDSIIRVFYVGMTRASETLILASPARKIMRRQSSLYVPLW